MYTTCCSVSLKLSLVLRWTAQFCCILIKVDCTVVVSQDEALVPGSLGSQRKQEVMSILGFIQIHGAQRHNDLKVKGQTEAENQKHIQSPTLM